MFKVNNCSTKLDYSFLFFRPKSPISGQSSLFIPPGNVKKRLVFLIISRDLKCTVLIWSFSGPYFPHQSKCRKTRTRKTPNMDTFHAVMSCTFYKQLCSGLNPQSWILSGCLELKAGWLWLSIWQNNLFLRGI